MIINNNGPRIFSGIRLGWIRCRSSTGTSRGPVSPARYVASWRKPTMEAQNREIHHGKNGGLT